MKIQFSTCILIELCPLNGRVTVKYLSTITAKTIRNDTQVHMCDKKTTKV